MGPSVSAKARRLGLAVPAVHGISGAPSQGPDGEVEPKRRHNVDLKVAPTQMARLFAVHGAALVLPTRLGDA